MKISAGFKPCIQCMRLAPTQYRPDSEGTYIVRLSPNNRTRLKVRNKSYLKVSYGETSTLACLIVDKSLNDDDIIRMDQTVRTAIGLDNDDARLRRQKILFPGQNITTANHH